MSFRRLAALLLTLLACQAQAITDLTTVGTCEGGNGSTGCNIAYDPPETCELMVLSCSGYNGAGMGGAGNWNQGTSNAFTEVCDSASSAAQVWMGYLVPNATTAGTVAFTANSMDGLSCVVACLGDVDTAAPVSETAGPIDAASISIGNLAAGNWTVGAVTSYGVGNDPTVSVGTLLGEASGALYLYWTNSAYNATGVTLTWTGTNAPSACAMEVVDVGGGPPPGPSIQLLRRRGR